MSNPNADPAQSNHSLRTRALAAGAALALLATGANEVKNETITRAVTGTSNQLVDNPYYDEVDPYAYKAPYPNGDARPVDDLQERKQLPESLLKGLLKTNEEQAKEEVDRADDLEKGFFEGMNFIESLTPETVNGLKSDEDKLAFKGKLAHSVRDINIATNDIDVYDDVALFNSLVSDETKTAIKKADIEVESTLFPLDYNDDLQNYGAESKPVPGEPAPGKPTPLELAKSETQDVRGVLYKQLVKVQDKIAEPRLAAYLKKHPEVKDELDRIKSNGKFDVNNPAFDYEFGAYAQLNAAKSIVYRREHPEQVPEKPTQKTSDIDENQPTSDMPSPPPSSEVPSPEVPTEKRSSHNPPVDPGSI